MSSCFCGKVFLNSGKSIGSISWKDTKCLAFSKRAFDCSTLCHSTVWLLTHCQSTVPYAALQRRQRCPHLDVADYRLWSACPSVPIWSTKNSPGPVSFWENLWSVSKECCRQYVHAWGQSGKTIKRKESYRPPEVRTGRALVGLTRCPKTDHPVFFQSTLLKCPDGQTQCGRCGFLSSTVSVLTLGSSCHTLPPGL